MSYTTDYIALRCAEISNTFMESMVKLGIPHGSEGIYADYFSYINGKKLGPREETCATSHEYQPLAQELAKAPVQTAFTLEHIRTFHDELDFLNDLELVFCDVKNGFTEGLRRCVDLHRCIPSATVTDTQGEKLRQSYFETCFMAVKHSGTENVSILLSIKYSSSDLLQEIGEMEVCQMSLDKFLDKDTFENIFISGLSEMLEAHTCKQKEPDTSSNTATLTIEQEIESLLASEDYLNLAELVNQRAAELDFSRILDLFTASIENIRTRSEAISSKTEITAVDDSDDVERSLQDISCNADSIFHSAFLCEAVVKAMVRTPRRG